MKKEFFQTPLYPLKNWIQNFPYLYAFFLKFFKKGPLDTGPKDLEKLYNNKV